VNVTLIYPGDLETRTGGYRYDKRMAEELARLPAGHAWDVSLLSLEGDYPFPNDKQLAQANAQLATIADGTLVLFDGLAFSTMPGVLEQHANRLNIVALVHHPLALETGLSESQARTLKALETQSLRHASHVITTSELTASSLSDYDVDSNKVSAVLPGTDVAPLAQGSSSGSINILCVATITARKGHHLLFEALASLQHYDWQLHCVGSTERDVDTYEALLKQKDELDLGARVHFEGELGDDEMERFFHHADVFVLASYHEGYGMVLTEAVARGLPIICTDGGAMPQTVPEGAGIIVPTGDATALGEALRRFFDSAETRQSLLAHAATAREQLRTWTDAASELSTKLLNVKKHKK